MPEPFTTSDRHDRDNPDIQFIPFVHYMKAEVEMGKKLVKVINDPNLSENDKKEQVWTILHHL